MDRDDYYDLQEVLTCLFKVIELGLLESPDIYTSSIFEKGKLILLPTHMYDTTNYKNYWLGECRSAFLWRGSPQCPEPDVISW